MYLITSGIKPFIYIGHPKTGSMSTRQALMELGAEEIYGQHGINYEIVEDVRLDGGVVCSTGRLPYDLIVSWYQHDCMCERPTFQGTLYEYLTWALSNHPYLSKGTLFPGFEVSNRTIWFEGDMQAQLNQYLEECDLPAVKLPHINATVHHDFRAYFGFDSLALVASVFHKDFENYGYHFC